MDSPRTLLLISSGRESSESLSLALASQGYLLQTASTAAEALLILRHRPCLVAIWEQDSPSGGGLDFLLQAREAQPDTRVLLCGGDRDTALGCLRHQAYCFFRKPFSSQVLFELLDHALAAGPWRPDLTLLSASHAWTTLELRARFSAGDRVVQFVRELSDPFPPAEADEFATALREILLNSIEHGGHTDANQKITLRLISTPNSLLCFIADPGPGFSLSQIPHAAVSNPPDQHIRHAELRQLQGLRPGGYGILVARNLVDELIYNQRGNEVLIVKNRRAPSAP
jgi:anti-sigma regulatory factor (Ser/Thr protein kinase)